MARTHALPVMLLAAVLLTGCASVATKRFEAPSVLKREIEAVPQVAFFDGHSGQPLSRTGLLDRTEDADAILFGELHGHPVGLPIAAAIWTDRLRYQVGSRQPALLLEFFERGQQLAIDEYLAGMIDEETFIKRSARSASNFPEGHQAMFDATRDAGGVVIAANAPRRYVSLARTEGYDHLRAMSPTQRATFVLPRDEQGPSAYRDRFVEAMGGMDASHGGSGPLDFLRSQLVWDATMADSVATALKAGHEPVALVVGRFHIEFNGATRHYLQRLRPGADVLSIVMVPTWSEELAEEDRGLGDIVVYVGPADASDEES